MTSQLFESSSLEDALAEVRDTVGPHAKIVRAEKVRRGGIAGFFSKETFVLSVERGEDDEATVRMVPAPPRAATTTADATPAAYSLDDLADAADQYDSAGGPQAAPPATQPIVPPAAEPEISTESTLFGQVLRDVSRATFDNELPAGPRWDGQLIDVESAYADSAAYRSVMPLVPAPIAPEAPAGPRANPIPSPRQPWWQVLADVAETERQAAATAGQSVPGLRMPRVASPAGPATPVPVVSSIDLDATPPRVQRSHPAPPPPMPPAPLLGADAIAHLLAESPNAAPEPDSVPSTINAALGPALLPGSVIAVVGHPSDAGTVAAWVAVAAAADPFSIHFASADPVARTASGLPGGRQVGSLDEAILRSRRWPSRPTPVVIVVDGRDAVWARSVLDAVEVTTVVALPSPLDDDAAVRSWVAALGGVQALLVDDSCRTTPESLARHGIPALRSPWSLDSATESADSSSGGDLR